ncbi:MAG: aldo/keto reductase [Phycisphaerales bacterium]|nr:aldo/keto reductase [Phycisphaerales bacterium]
MKYRILGKTGLKVSVVGIGTWQFGGEWGKEFAQPEVDAMFRRAEELGVNLLDTAECYGDHTSEAFVGQAIEGKRSNWIVATKFGHKFNKPFDRSEPRSAADVRQQLEDSLKALRTDHVDLYQYHSWGDEQFFDQQVQAELEKMLRQGKIRHLGNSIGSNVNVKQVEASASKKIEFIQLVYNRLDRHPETTTLPLCQEHNLGVLARVPLASGFLSGKYQPGHLFDASEVRGKWGKPDKREHDLIEVQRIARQEVPVSVSMAQWALAWCLKNPAVTAVIPGCKSVAQVESNAGAAGLLES